MKVLLLYEESDGQQPSEFYESDGRQSPKSEQSDGQQPSALKRHGWNSSTNIYKKSKVKVFIEQFLMNHFSRIGRFKILKFISHFNLKKPYSLTRKLFFNS